MIRAYRYAKNARKVGRILRRHPRVASFEVVPHPCAVAGYALRLFMQDGTAPLVSE